MEALRDVTLAFFGLINTDSDEMFQTEAVLDIVFCCFVFFPETLWLLFEFVQLSREGEPPYPTHPISPTPRGYKDNIYKGEMSQVFLFLFWNDHSSGCAGSGG